MKKRVFLLVMDSLGVGEAPDAADWGDAGSNTLGAIRKHPDFDCPTLSSLGLFHISGVGGGVGTPRGAYGRLRERSRGKDTTIGHWEIAGLVSEHPLPTYPHGFPPEVIHAFEERVGRRVLCNKPYSGTDVIRDYGEEQRRTGALIVYTSADSVFQIAAHEASVPVEELYRICETARELLVGEHGVGRVIARPFTGEYPFTRTARRHDFSLEPPGVTLPELLVERGLDSISVGKIYDIFAGCGFSAAYRTSGNDDGMERTLALAGEDFHGLCFVNLVDFDMLYGHRNDIGGYAAAMTRMDRQLARLLERMREEDLLLLCADHGCDPSTPSTDHSREDVPVLVYGKGVKPGVDLGLRLGFCDIAATVAEYLGLDTEGRIAGDSFWKDIAKEERA